MNGNKDIDLINIISNGDASDFTDTINEQEIQVSYSTVETSPSPNMDPTTEDMDMLNEIMNEIVELNNSNPGEVSKPKLSRMDSMSMLLGDYSLKEFDEFESNIQMNDPMLGNDILSKTLNIF